MPIFDWYDGKLAGSRKCICNGGAWYPYCENIASDQQTAETQSSTTPVEWQSRVWEQNYQHWNIAPLDDSVS